MAMDVGQVLLFSPLHGKTAMATLPDRYMSLAKCTLVFWEPGLSPDDPGLISIRSRAVLRVLGYAALPVSFLAAFEGIPGFTTLVDQLYRFIATVRYQLGQPSEETCALLEQDSRHLP
jgi:predicted DCC family thiol-disulfide oxidoreductase YuxK